jgi:hypothetical protein
MEHCFIYLISVYAYVSAKHAVLDLLGTIIFWDDLLENCLKIRAFIRVAGVKERRHDASRKALTQSSPKEGIKIRPLG